MLALALVLGTEDEGRALLIVSVGFAVTFGVYHGLDERAKKRHSKRDQ